MTRYSYVTIRYTPDFLGGECLNVGVLVFSPEAGFLKLLWNKTRTKRLADAFRGFSQSINSAALNDLDLGLNYLRQTDSGPQFSFEGRPADAFQIMKRLWPDKGSRYTFGDVVFGASADLQKTANDLFERLVMDQIPCKATNDRVKDDKVWKGAEALLRPRVQLNKLVSDSVATVSGPIEVQRVYRNGKTHIFQALSFDLADSAAITRKASVWFGNAYSFSKTEGLGDVLYLLGKPRAPEEFETFIKARELLLEARSAKIFDEDHMDPFVDEVASLVGTR